MDPEVLLQLAIDEDWDAELSLLATFMDNDASRVFHKGFDLDSFSVSECEDFFRFSPAHIVLLCNLLGMPGSMSASNGKAGHGTKASGKCSILGYIVVLLQYYLQCNCGYF